jgi:hypothetical protein
LNLYNQKHIQNRLPEFVSIDPYFYDMGKETAKLAHQIRQGARPAGCWVIVLSVFFQPNNPNNLVLSAFKNL